MPLFGFLCQDCGNTSEFLVSARRNEPICEFCGSGNLKKTAFRPFFPFRRIEKRYAGPRGYSVLRFNPSPSELCRPRKLLRQRSVLIKLSEIIFLGSN